MTERIPTTCPLRFDVRTAHLGADGPLAEIETRHATTHPEWSRAYEKRMMAMGSVQQQHPDNDNADAVITFNADADFSYHTHVDEVDAARYDFVTVAMQAIFKALGFNLLNAVDADNQESLFMQPVIARGTAIRYIGKTMDQLLADAQWVTEQWPFEGVSTAEVLSYGSTPAGTVGQLSVLLKSGDYEPVASLAELNTVDSLYARTSDGYVRLRTVSPAAAPQSTSYQLYDFMPQVIKFRVASAEPYNSSQTLYTVSIEMCNTEGCDYAYVEQTDSYYPQPYYTYIDVSAGRFDLLVDIRYPCTIKLYSVHEPFEEISCGVKCPACDVYRPGLHAFYIHGSW